MEGDGGGGEGFGEVGVVGPGRECWPVGDGVGDDAGLVWVDEVSQEFQWVWWGFQSLYSSTAS